MEILIGNAGRPRFLASVIDNFIAIVLAIVAVSIVNTNTPWIGGTVLAVTYLSYYLIFEALLSRTPGKYFQGLEVCKLDGTRCGFGAILIRTLMRLFEVNPILLGALPAGVTILLTWRKQRMGDFLGKSLVILTKDKPNKSPATALDR